MEELQNNLGYVDGKKTDDTPLWVYGRYYWTMTSDVDNTARAWFIAGIDAIKWLKFILK